MKSYIIKFFISIGLMVLSVPVVAQYNPDRLKLEAERGDTSTQYQLGYYYLHDEIDSAILWLAPHATKGHPNEQILLGKIYCKFGEMQKAIEWISMSAKKGDVIAQNNLNMLMEYEALEQNLDYQGYDDDVQNDIEQWKRVAEKEDTAAQYRLGLLYLLVHNDYESAIFWFDKAAHKGHIDAQLYLGKLYYFNEEYENAQYWLTMIAEEGNAQAQFIIGQLCLELHDTSNAVYWYTKAYEQGYDEAKLRLRLMSEYIGKQYDIAKWKKEAKAGDTTAQFKIGLYYLERMEYDSTIVWLTPLARNRHVGAQLNLGKAYYYDGELGEVGEKARYWLNRLATQGHPEAQFFLGKMYDGAEKNDSAVLWYTKASMQGFVDAQTELGYLYYKNENMQLATYWLLAAAYQGDVFAQYIIGNLYDEGNNINRAKYWLAKAASKGMTGAQYKLGFFYQFNKKDKMNAKKWYLQASIQGHYEAPLVLADLYRIEGDSSNARKWLMFASAQGNKRAKELLEIFFE